MRRELRDAAVLALVTGLILASAGVLLAGIGGGGGAAAAAVDGYLIGCAYSCSGDNTVIVQPGVLRDKADAVTITYASAVTITTADQSFDAGLGGGLDVGTTRAPNGWYYIHATNHATASFLLSESRTNPTLPGGVTRTRWIGTGRTDASADWFQCESTGGASRRVSYVRENVIDGAVSNVLNGGTATSFTLLGLSAAVPPEARFVAFWGEMASAQALHIVSRGGGGNDQERTLNAGLNAVVQEGTPEWCRVGASQTAQYRVSGGSAKVSVEGYGLEVDGSE